MKLIDQVMDDLSIANPSEHDEKYLNRKLAAIMGAIKRVTGRDFAAKSWRETHAPTSSGTLWVANPPIREMLSGPASYEPETGEVMAGTTADTVIEYDGGYDSLPAEIYDAILSLMGQAWSQKSGAGLAAVPGVTELQLYDVGSVKFAGNGNADAILGVYDDLFRYYASSGSHIGLSTLKRAEEI